MTIEIILLGCDSSMIETPLDSASLDSYTVKASDRPCPLAGCQVKMNCIFALLAVRMLAVAGTTRHLLYHQLAALYDRFFKLARYLISFQTSRSNWHPNHWK
jgi:hypothetical protein